MGFVLGLVFLAVVVIIALISAENNQKYWVIRNGLPFCPNCNRQVSLKAARPFCRAAVSI
jgi:hypothetical protein